MSTAVDALLDATPIGVADDTGRAPILSTTFGLVEGHGEVAAAVLTVSAHGIVMPQVNGRPASGALFAPGWTSYEWRIQACGYDITALLQRENRIDILLGNGWWRGSLGFAGANANYGDTLVEPPRVV